MESIKIESGVKEYNIENQRGEFIGVFTFNPSDADLPRRYNETLKAFQAMKLSCSGKNVDLDEFVEIQKQAVEQLCYFVGNDSVKVFFEVMGAFSMQNGQFYYEKVLDIIAGIITSESNTQSSKLKNKIKKYARKHNA